MARDAPYVCKSCATNVLAAEVQVRLGVSVALITTIPLLRGIFPFPVARRANSAYSNHRVKACKDGRTCAYSPGSMVETVLQESQVIFRMMRVMRSPIIGSPTG